MKLMLPAPRMVKKSLRLELANAWFPNHALLQGFFAGLAAQPEARRRFLANLSPEGGRLAPRAQPGRGVAGE